MRIWITFIISLCLASQVVAQQGPQFSLAPLDPFFVNPAYAGMDGTMKINGIYRSQWVNHPGSPQSQLLNLHTPLYFAGGGLGVQFLNERLGPEQQMSANVSYNYQLFLNRNSTLSFGLSAGFLQYTLNGDQLRTPDGIYEGITIDHQDARLVSGRVSQMAPLFNAGVYYRTGAFEAGASVRNLAASEISISSISFASERQYMAHLRYFWDLGRSLQLIPSVWMRSNLIQTQIDFNILARINDNIFGGVSFRGYDANSVDALILQAGIRLNEKITLAYAYDLTLSPLKQTSDGSHEVMVQYDLGIAPGKGRLPAIIYHPRMK
ncbi:MAG: type IX secretion system membrane protein PorP/SprF [Bacteroidetes bacterium]|nr:type IX secretion system membrane protein PorP/SprF [Bacteroidota bacterium]